MKTNKRSYLFAVLAVLLMAFAVIPGGAETVYAEGSEVEIGALKYWIESDGTVVVCGWAEENTSRTELTIPASVEYGSKSYTVTKIENSAFKNDSYITTLTVGDGVKEIDPHAFEGCTKLEYISLPDTLTSIGNGAFYDTEYYKDQNNWESGVLYIGNYLIKGKLDDEYTVNDGTKLIADGAFSGEGLSAIIIPASVERIGKEAFVYSGHLSQVTFEAGSCLKYIGEDAFFNCSSLQSINLPESEVEIRECVFMDTGFTSIVLPEGLERIKAYTFANCSKLKEVTIPSTVKEIEDGAFNNTPLERIFYGGSPSQWAAITGDGKPNNELVEYKNVDYTVTFVDGQEHTLKIETVPGGYDATAPEEPTREGYVFKGWDKAFKKITDNITVTAQWAKLYTVTFVDGQGKTLKTETVESGKAATAPSTPTRDGYTFTGWDKDFSKITADTTVTAQWKKNADPAPAPVSIKDAKVLLSAESFTYTGKIRKPVIKTVAGKALKEGTDYTANWSNAESKDAGSYTITITGKGGYTGTTKAAYKITKAANPLKIKGRTATIKYSKLKKKNRKLAVKKVIKVVKKGKGKLTYKKVSGSKKITINTKTGKVTVKKGLKKGKYKVKVKVKAAGNKNYKASKAKKVTFTIVVQ